MDTCFFFVGVPSVISRLKGFGDKKFASAVFFKALPSVYNL
jgi:hypothetical protein